MGYPSSWMVYFMENPNLKWIINGVSMGVPIYGNHTITASYLPSGNLT